MTKTGLSCEPPYHRVKTTIILSLKKHIIAANTFAFGFLYIRKAVQKMPVESGDFNNTNQLIVRLPCIFIERNVQQLA